MPIYTFICSRCRRKKELIRQMKDATESCTCAYCTLEMQRDFGADVPFTSSKDYGKAIVSDSLAVNPSQIAEHRKQFPDIKITPAGQPVFENYKQHDAYLKKCGFVKVPKKIKS